LLLGRRSKDHDPARFFFVFVSEQSARVELQGAKVLICGPDPYYPAIGGVKGADFRNLPPQLGADIFNEVTFVADQAGIVDGQANLAAGRQSASLRAGAATPDNHQVFAESLHVLFLIHREASSQAHQQNHRSDSPDDPEHREESAHLVRFESCESLAEDFGESHGTQASGLRVKVSGQVRRIWFS
jgi:hypothetical protein